MTITSMSFKVVELESTPDMIQWVIVLDHSRIKHPAVPLGSTHLLRWTRHNNKIMISKKEGKRKEKRKNHHAATHGWLTNCWTDISARYLTSGFECVIKSITRALAPKSVTYLRKKRKKKKSEYLDEKNKKKTSASTYFFPRSQCLTYWPTSLAAIARILGSVAVCKIWIRILKKIDQ